MKELNLLRQLFDRRDKIQYLGLLALMGGGTALEVLGVGAVPTFISTLASPERVLARSEVQSVLGWLGVRGPEPRELLIWGSVSLFVLFLVKNAYLILLGHIQQEMTERQKVRLSSRLFEAYVYAPHEFHLQRNSAEIMRKLTSDTTEVVSSVINPLLKAVMDGLTLVALVGLLFFAADKFALPALGVLGLASVMILRRLRHRLRELGQAVQVEKKDGIKAVDETFKLLPEIRVLGREGAFAERFSKSFARLAHLGRLKRVLTMASGPLLEVVAIGSLVMLVIVGTVRNRTGDDMLAELALFAAAVVRLKNSITSIVNAYGNIQFSVAPIPGLVQDLNSLEKHRERTRVVPASQDQPFAFTDLAINEVTYTYPGAHAPSLSGVSLTIRAHQSVAFVGTTGSGKTTLLHMIAGFTEPHSGTIAANGQLIRSFDWRRSLGYVPQLITLIDDSLARNIALGIADEEVDPVALRRAVEAAQLSDFVDSLPNGLDTRVGERGVRISGGQRQRVGLARALYRDPPILLMDEATSALDNETERKVMASLMKEQKRTFIVVAHRLSTIEGCDEIFLLQKGTVVARGDYKTLMKESEAFRNLAGKLESQQPVQT